MKLLLMICCCVTSSAIFAQYINPQVHKYNAFRGDSNFHLKMFPLGANQRPPGIYRLPIDRMPCVVPDLRASVAIPNAWKGPVMIPFHSQIPNPSLPNQEPNKNSLKTK